MRAMILAAGFGTRLASLGLGLPKPLFPVLNVPLIRWAISFLRGHGITEIVVNLHHRGEAIRRELGDGSDAGVRIHYSVEPDEILGTGGGIKHALPLLGDETFVVMNGKIVTDLDLHAAIAHHRAADADATLVVRPDPHAHEWGAVSVDAEGRVRGLLGDPAPLPPGLTDYMFTGIHVLEPEFVRRAIPDGPACIVQQGYRPALRGEGPGAQSTRDDGPVRLAAHVHRGYFWDHSTPERWLTGNLNLLTGRTPEGTPAAARFPPPGPGAYLEVRDAAPHGAWPHGASPDDAAPRDTAPRDTAPRDAADTPGGDATEREDVGSPGHASPGHAHHAPYPSRAAAAQTTPRGARAPEQEPPDSDVAEDADLRASVYLEPAAEIASGAVVGPQVLVGQAAHIGAKSHIGPAVVLGPGARVAPGVTLERTLVYAGAQVTQSVASAIVTPDGRVHPIDLANAGPRSGPALGQSRGGS